MSIAISKLTSNEGRVDRLSDIKTSTTFSNCSIVESNLTSSIVIITNKHYFFYFNTICINLWYKQRCSFTFTEQNKPTLVFNFVND